MNYAHKKYQLEGKWLTQKFKRLNFFVLVHLKPCNASEWVGLQKELAKFNLKITLMSIRKFDSSSSFFSKLGKNFKMKLLRGQSAIILNEGVESISKVVSILKTFTMVVRPLILYVYSRFLNYNVSEINLVETLSISEWGSIFNRINSPEIMNVLTSHNYFLSLLKMQHITILNLLIKKINNVC